MKHKYRYIFFCLFVPLLICIALPVKAQKGVVNRGAHIEIGQGAYFKVERSPDADFISLPYDTLDASINLDGMLMVQGGWHDGNSERSVFVGLNDIGCLILNGSSLQTVSGQNPLTFENLELNNPEGLTLQTDINLGQDLILTKGLLQLNDHHLLLSSEAGINGSFSNTTMVVADGNGQLRKRFNGNTSFTFPVGDVTGDHQYSPVEFHLNGYSSLSSAWVGVHLSDQQHLEDTSRKNYISRYWQIQSLGISNPRYEASFYFTGDDLHGDPSNIYNAFIRESTTQLYEKADIPNKRLFYQEMEAFGAYTGTMGMQPIVPEASGSWSNQIGGTSPAVNVLIPAGISIELKSSGTLRKVNDVTLEPGASLTVGDTLHLSGSLYLESDESGTASMIQEEGKLQVDGQIYIYGYLASNPANDHHDEVAVPVNGAHADVFGPLSGENHLFEWKERTGEHAEVTDPDLSLDVLKGYRLKSSQPRVVTFQGQPIMGEQTRELTRSPNSAQPGYHLVANPYTASINWDTTLWDNSHLLPTIWYLKEGGYATYNRLAGVGINGGQPYIAPMQAFWIRVAEGNASGTYRTRNDLRTHQRPLTGNRDDLQSGDQLLKLMVESDGYSDELALGFFSDASDSYGGYDSPKRLASDRLPQIYTESDGQLLAINSMSAWEGPYEIPLCLRFPKQDEYRLRASSLALLDGSIEVILEDLEVGEQTNLRQQESYSFRSDEGQTCNRFVLHLAGAETAINRVDPQKLDIYGFENQVYIRVGADRLIQQNSTIILFNLLGQKVYEESHLLHRGVNRIQTHIPAGYYIIQLRQNGSIRSERIYLEQ